MRNPRLLIIGIVNERCHLSSCIKTGIHTNASIVA